MIGYQFSVIRKFQNSIFQKIRDNYLPDHILTIGEYNKRKIKVNFKKKLKYLILECSKIKNYIQNNIKFLKGINLGFWLYQREYLIKDINDSSFTKNNYNKKVYLI